MTLPALPDGADVVEAAPSIKKMCAKDGEVAEAASNPCLVSDCAVLLDVKNKLEGKAGRKLNWSPSLPIRSTRASSSTLAGWFASSICPSGTVNASIISETRANAVS